MTQGRLTMLACLVLASGATAFLGKAHHDVAAFLRPMTGAVPDLLPSHATWTGGRGLVLVYRFSLVGAVGRVAWTWRGVDLEYQ